MCRISFEPQLRLLLCLALGIAAASLRPSGALAAPQEPAGPQADEIHSPAAHTSPTAPPIEETLIGPLAGLGRLERKALACAVLARNPNIEAAEYALEAAEARVGQPTSIGDTMLSYAFAPLSIGANDLRFGQVIQAEQWFRLGRTRIERRAATARARVAEHQIASVRNRLAFRASVLFADYYAVERALETNEHHQEVIRDLRAVAEAQYAGGKGTQQDPLQAELELAELERSAVSLRNEREIVLAQLNALLHRPPGARLPPAPAELRPEPSPVDQQPLLALALHPRPELRARAAEVEQARLEAEVARRGFAPDMSVMVQYNSMWPMWRHQFMAGIGVRVPLQVRSIQGDVREARAEVAAARAALSASRDNALAEVEQARQTVQEAAEIVDLYRNRLRPTARQQLEAAEIAYSTGRSDFQAVLDAERSLRTVDLGLDRALADLEQAGAMVDYAVGRIPECENRGGA